ncbi:MAG TPA: tetratricopeptide repeat protein, partial [Ktedonobacteraceae bacterium]
RISPIQLLSALNVLLLQNLLQASTEGRYQLHAIVADYASRNFNEKSEHANHSVRQAMHSKAVRYYLQQAARNYPSRDNRLIISDVQPFIEAIWHLCQAKQWQKAYDLAKKEYLFADLRRWREYAVLLELCQLLLPGNWHPKPLVASLIYSNLAWAYDMLGEKEEAKWNYQEALGIFMKLMDRMGQGETLNNLGGVYLALGEKEKALSSYEEARRVRREVGDRKGEGVALYGLGSVYEIIGQQEKALEYYEEALYMKQEVGDQGEEGEMLLSIGALYFELRRYDAALAYVLRAREIFEEIQSPLVDLAESRIAAIRRMVGDLEFAPLLAKVGPQVQQIVEKSLYESA